MEDPSFPVSLSHLLGYQQERIALDWIIDQIFSFPPACPDFHTEKTVARSFFS